MDMILICPNLKERNLKAFADFQAGFFEFFIYVGSENHSSVLGRTNDVVQQN